MSKKISINLILTLLLVLFIITLPITVPMLRDTLKLSPIGSGSGWEIDYGLDWVDLNGDVYEYETDDNSMPADDTSGGFSGGGGSYTILMNPFIDAYQFSHDPDGEPRVEGSYIEGRGSGFYIVMSGWMRVDRFGNRLDFSQADPNQVAHETGASTQYEYYYQFDIRGGTESDLFDWFGYQLCECSSFDATTKIEIRLQETIFGPITGTFMDATIVDYDHIDLQLQSGLDFDIHPAVNPRAIGYQLQVQDRQESDDAYTCKIIVPFSMNAGTTKTGFALMERNRYDVWIDYTVRFTILLEEPLDIGTQGTNLTGGEAPAYIPPYDWRIVLIVAVVILVILAMACIVTRRK